MCKHCETVDIYTNNGSYYVPNGDAAIWHGLVTWGIEIRSKMVAIRYCPWCGRELKERNEQD